MNELLEMKLHDTIRILDGKYVITRVPGGWIYDRQEPKVNISRPIFIPYQIDRILIDKDNL